MLSNVNEDRALALLGKGVSASQVASAIGVSPSRISQLLADEVFADKVSALRFEALTEKSSRDRKYDSLEDKLQAKLEKSLPLMIRPAEILKAISVVNSAKRRGSQDLDAGEEAAPIVNLALPTFITQKFTVNVNNQVISAGDQSLVTMQSGTLLDIGKQREEDKKELRQEQEEARLANSEVPADLPSSTLPSPISKAKLKRELEDNEFNI